MHNTKYCIKYTLILKTFKLHNIKKIIINIAYVYAYYYYVNKKKLKFTHILSRQHLRCIYITLHDIILN